MLWVFGQLFAPIRYLRIENGERLFQSKLVYDWFIPVFMALSVVLGCWLLDLKLSQTGYQRVLDRIAELLALLIAFYMAALAAVSTFDRKGLDETIAPGHAILNRYSATDEMWRDENLTYREYICYLFGYLSFLSIFIYIAVMVFDIVHAKLDLFIAPIYIMGISLASGLNLFFVFLFLFFLAQLLITSLLGIYFLTERIQTISRK
jgi:hypothetical protein